METEKRGVEVATEEHEFTLPSRGLLYGGKLPDGQVKLRPMTLKDEKVLFASRSDVLDRLHSILDRCLLTRDVPLSDMLSGDRFFLFVMLRVISFESSYSFKMTCPRCSHSFRYSLPLDKGLEIKMFDGETTDPFKVKLPRSGHTLELRHLRVRDEDAIRQYRRKQKSKALVGEGPSSEDGDPAYSFAYATRIVSIDGVPTKGVLEAVSFCEGLGAYDAAFLRTTIDENSCGVDLRIHVECPDCSYEIEQMLPVEEEFFFPRVGAKRGDDA